MLVDKEQQQRKKFLTETILATIFSFGIVIFIIFISFNFLLNNNLGFLFRGDNENVLGTQSDNDSQNYVFIQDQEKTKQKTQITSGLYFQNILLYDNLNREYLEGMTIPNAVLDIYIADTKISTTANPNGFFSVKFPEETIQFALVKIVAFERSSQVGESVKFVIVLKNYLGRNYFALMQRGEIFSLEIDSEIKNQRDVFDEFSKFPCNFKQETDVNERDFDITQDLNLVILPSQVESLNFKDNKFVAFRATNSLGDDKNKDCVLILKQSEKSLMWHTSQINEILKRNHDYQNNDEFLTTFSNPLE